jgi:hypothetical protein
MRASTHQLRQLTELTLLERQSLAQVQWIEDPTGGTDSRSVFPPRLYSPGRDRRHRVPEPGTLRLTAHDLTERIFGWT